MAGVSGHIRKTVNGGTNWTQLTNNINYVITALAFIDADHGYAVGYDYNHVGRIYTTSNGGTSWSVSTISSDHYLFSVDYADANTVYIVGENGTILRSVVGDSDPSNNGPICEGTALELSAPSVAGASFLWTGPNDFTSTLQNPIVSPAATTALTGTYQLTTTVNTCTTLNTTTTVVVHAIPSAPVAENNGPVAASTPLTLTASPIADATYTWTGPNGFTSTEQDPTVSTSATLAMAGEYEVVATVNGCAGPAGSTTVIVSTSVGDEELMGSAPVRIYPNPASVGVTVDLGELQRAQLDFYNATGECVIQHTVYGGRSTVDISGLPSGIYMIRSTSVDGIFQQKLVKN